MRVTPPAWPVVNRYFCLPADFTAILSAEHSTTVCGRVDELFGGLGRQGGGDRRVSSQLLSRAAGIVRFLARNIAPVYSAFP